MHLARLHVHSTCILFLFDAYVQLHLLHASQIGVETTAEPAVNFASVSFFRAPFSLKIFGQSLDAHCTRSRTSRPIMASALTTSSISLWLLILASISHAFYIPGQEPRTVTRWRLRLTASHRLFNQKLQERRKHSASSKQGLFRQQRTTICLLRSTLRVSTVRRETWFFEICQRIFCCVEPGRSVERRSHQELGH